jgi:4-alpha-glucanotransferase
MNLTFRLRYHTHHGQSLFLSGNHPRLGDGDPAKAIPLRYLDSDHWEVAVEFPQPPVAGQWIDHHYILRAADGSLVHDCGNGRRIDSAAFQYRELLVVDSWNDAGFCGNVFDTEPFKQVLLKANHTGVRVPDSPSATHAFRVKAPLLPSGQTLCLLGATAALGNWNTANPILLNRSGNVLSVRLDLGRETFPLVYKYGVYDLDQKSFVGFEAGANRALNDVVAPGKHTIVNDGFAALPADTWKGAGVAIPVFSLRSEHSFGAGDFTDLKRLADWCRLAGLKLIQLLPVNDTSATHTWTDSYPYAAISAFALHPLYLNLSRVATDASRQLLQALEPERRRLNALDEVDYEAVMRTKLDFIRQIYPAQRKETFASREYLEFFQNNRHWLVPYAAFCHLRDRNGTADFNRWPAHQRYDPGAIERLAAEGTPEHDAIALNYFIQFHLHAQLQEATEHAHARGVVVKGDIPIGVHRHGADAWQQPELFHMEFQAGAPPDAFATKGQNWGFPTYNWPRMKQDGFAWWKRRFEQMSRYFDAFRIDHILGFFRIWSIPAHAVEGILGIFVPAIPVKAEEFSRRGIEFDRERFTRPFISDAVLAELFGGDREMVKQKFLDASHRALKPEFATQRGVERYFAAQPPTESNRRIQAGLYDLISNVILFEAEGGFHFRFAMENTSSFRQLAPPAQSKLKELYVDYFFRRQENFWLQEAAQKLPALKRVTNMLMCGEDLGLVPECVPGLMKQLGVLSLEVQRMPKQLHREFSRPANAPYLSVITPSTHDMSTIRGWWEEDRAGIQRFYNQELGRPGEAPRRCESWISRAIIRQHLASPAMWSIFQLQDLLGMDEPLRRADVAAERINVPAIPVYYWKYRMHLTLEGLQRAETFNGELKVAIEQNGR